MMTGGDLIGDRPVQVDMNNENDLDSIPILKSWLFVKNRLKWSLAHVAKRITVSLSSTPVFDEHSNPYVYNMEMALYTGRSSRATSDYHPLHLPPDNIPFYLFESCSFGNLITA